MMISREVRFGSDERFELIGWIFGERKDLAIGGSNWSRNCWKFSIGDETELFALGLWIDNCDKDGEDWIWCINPIRESQLEFLSRYKNFVPMPKQ